MAVATDFCSRGITVSEDKELRKITDGKARQKRQGREIYDTIHNFTTSCSVKTKVHIGKTSIDSSKGYK